MKRVLCAALLALWPSALAAQEPAPQRPAASRPHPFADPGLTESSGAAFGGRNPDVLWTLNDSGNDPLLFATDTLGRARARVRISGAANVDWEDLAYGPCGVERCLYIADTGDNAEKRLTSTLYRIREPRLPSRAATPATLSAKARRLIFRFPDRARDTEAIFVDRRGDTWLITKGRGAPAALFRIRAAAWTEAQPATAEPRGEVPGMGGQFGLYVTGASLAGDGRTVAIRTYFAIHFFQFDDKGQLRPQPRPVCNLLGLEPQGEGIAWLSDSTLVVTSEHGFGLPSSVTVVRCRA